MRAAFVFLIYFFLGCLACTNDNDTGSLEGDSTAPVVEMNAYSGPGSFWTAEISQSTFTMERAPDVGQASELFVSGTVETLASGYQRFTAVDVSGSASDLPSSGDVSYGFEIPGFFTLIQPFGADDGELLPMLVSGDCPVGDIDFNWIVTGYGGSNDLATAADLVGVANFDFGSSQFAITAQHSLDGTDVTNPQMLPLSTCSTGFLQIDTGGGAMVDMWLSSTGGALVRTPEETVILAMPAESFSASDLASKQFYGLVLDENQAESGDKVQPVWVNFDNTGGAGNAGLWEDAENNLRGAGTAELVVSQFDAPQTGFMQIGLSVDSTGDGAFDQGGGNMICQYKSNLAGSSKDMLFCAGHTGADTTKLFNVLLVSQ